MKLPFNQLRNHRDGRLFEEVMIGTSTPNFFRILEMI